MTFNQLHQRAIECVKNFKSAESELISILQQIDDNKGFRSLGYSSLFLYATQALSLSESHAYASINVARKAKEVPELAGAIAEGVLNTSQAPRTKTAAWRAHWKRFLPFTWTGTTLCKRQSECFQNNNPQGLKRETVKRVPPPQFQPK